MYVMMLVGGGGAYLFVRVGLLWAMALQKKGHSPSVQQVGIIQSAAINRSR